MLLLIDSIFTSVISSLLTGAVRLLHDAGDRVGLPGGHHSHLEGLEQARRGAVRAPHDVDPQDGAEIVFDR